MRTTLFLIVLTTIGATVSTCHWPPKSATQPINVASQGPTIEKLERLAQLVTARVYVADVLVGDGDGYRGAWLIRGDALIGVDLARAKIVEKDDTAHRATIILPNPAVLQSRVDHSRTKTWEVKKTAWMPWSGDQDRLRDDVMREAQELVAHVAAADGNIDRARLTAETMIQGFFSELGWQVAVTWSTK